MQKAIYTLCLTAGILLAVCASCTTDLVVDVPAPETQLVVYGYMETDKPFTVYVTTSYGLNSNPNSGPVTTRNREDRYVKDATVEIWEGGSLLTSLPYRDSLQVDTSGFGIDYYVGHYEGPNAITPIPGRSYELRITHPTYPDVRAVATAQAPVIPAEVEYEQNATRETDIDGFSADYGVIKLGINSPATTEIFYQVRANMIIRWPYDTTFVDTSSAFVTPIETYTSQNLVEVENPFHTPQTAITTSGGLSTLLYALAEESYVYYDGNEEIPADLLGIEIFLESTDQSVADFLNAFRRQYNAQDAFSLFPTEAITIPGNIEGGIGVFGSYNQRRAVYRF